MSRDCSGLLEPDEVRVPSIPNAVMAVSRGSRDIESYLTPGKVVLADSRAETATKTQVAGSDSSLQVDPTRSLLQDVEYGSAQFITPAQKILKFRWCIRLKCERSMQGNSPPGTGGVARSAGVVDKSKRFLPALLSANEFKTIWYGRENFHFATTPALRATPPVPGGEFLFPAIYSQFQTEAIPFAIIRSLMRDPFSETRSLLWLGIAGLTLAALSGVIALTHGTIILPEGDLTKSLSFDAAVGIYVLTLALFVPLAEFTPFGRRRWIRFVVGLTSFGYAVETIQVLRGIDPRFSRVGGAADQIAGALFGISALGIMTMFIILAVKLWRRPLAGPNQLLLLAFRYASIVTMFGFLSGLWMGALQGRHVGPAGNVLPLHALCFHAIQTVPLVALFLSRSNFPDAQSKFWIHWPASPGSARALRSARRPQWGNR
jgi:hypothetical protein